MMVLTVVAVQKPASVARALATVVDRAPISKGT